MSVYYFLNNKCRNNTILIEMCQIYIWYIGRLLNIIVSYIVYNLD